MTFLGVSAPPWSGFQTFARSLIHALTRNVAAAIAIRLKSSTLMNTIKRSQRDICHIFCLQVNISIDKQVDDSIRIEVFCPFWSHVPNTKTAMPSPINNPPSTERTSVIPRGPGAVNPVKLKTLRGHNREINPVPMVPITAMIQRIFSMLIIFNLLNGE